MLRVTVLALCWACTLSEEWWRRVFPGLTCPACPASAPTVLSLENQNLNGTVQIRHLPPLLTSLNLASNNLSGVFNLSLLPPGLTELNIENNNFHLVGKLPSPITTFRGGKNSEVSGFGLDNLYQSTHLVTFSIPDLGMSGSLNTRLLPSSLRILDINHNQFHGSLDWTGLPNSLVEFYADANLFTGDVQLTQLPRNLQKLSIQACQFDSLQIATETLPRTLDYINVRGNNLHTEITLCKPRLASLVKVNIDFSFNTALTGLIHPFWVDMVHIQHTQLTVVTTGTSSSNAAQTLTQKCESGGSWWLKTFPETPQCVQCTVEHPTDKMLLSNSALTGTVNMTDIHTYTNLAMLDLSNNTLEGEFDLCQIPNQLHTLNISNNKFRITVSNPRCNIPRLTELYMGGQGNTLDGIDTLTFLHGLRILHMKGIHISSLPTLPARLRELVLHNNQLRMLSAQRIPRDLDILSIKNNNLVSFNFPQLPPNVTTVHMDNNEIQGNLNISSLPKHLTALSLAHNALSSIDVTLLEITDSRDLEVDVSYNQLANTLWLCEVDQNPFQLKLNVSVNPDLEGVIHSSLTSFIDITQTSVSTSKTCTVPAPPPSMVITEGPNTPTNVRLSRSSSPSSVSPSSIVIDTPSTKRPLVIPCLLIVALLVAGIGVGIVFVCRWKRKNKSTKSPSDEPPYCVTPERSPTESPPTIQQPVSQPNEEEIPYDEKTVTSDSSSITPQQRDTSDTTDDCETQSRVTAGAMLPESTEGSQRQPQSQDQIGVPRVRSMYSTEDTLIIEESDSTTMTGHTFNQDGERLRASDETEFEAWLTHPSGKTMPAPKLDHLESHTIISGKEHEWEVTSCILGSGGSARVYLGYRKADRMKVAVKFQKNPVKDKSKENREITIMEQFKHPNIVNFYDAIETEDGEHIFIVLEYIAGGSLRRLLSEVKTLSVSHTRYYTKQVLQGLDCLHSCGVIHRDIKPDNILITSDGVVKLADFGIAKKDRAFQKVSLKTSTGDCCFKGTPAYTAPELLSSDEASIAQDVWAVGIMMIEMLSGLGSAWTHLQPEEGGKKHLLALLYVLSQKSTVPQIPSTAPTELQQLISCCCTREKADRISVRDLLQHPFFADAPLCETPPNIRVAPEDVKKDYKGAKKQAQTPAQAADHQPCNVNTVT